MPVKVFQHLCWIHGTKNWGALRKKKKKSTEQPPHEGSEGSRRLLPELERKPGGGLVVGSGGGGLVTLCAVLAKLSASKSKAVMSLLWEYENSAVQFVAIVPYYCITLGWNDRKAVSPASASTVCFTCGLVRCIEQFHNSTLHPWFTAGTAILVGFSVTHINRGEKCVHSL